VFPGLEKHDISISVLLGNIELRVPKVFAFLNAVPECAPPTSASLCVRDLATHAPEFRTCLCVTHANSPSARNIGFCVIWVCIVLSSSSSSKTLVSKNDGTAEYFGGVVPEVVKTSPVTVLDSFRAV
jgi:hypothetical protein